MLLNAAEKTIDTLYAMIPRKKPTSHELQNIRVIAHRGAHERACGIIENTMPAFENALSLQCWGIELDIRCTKDHQLVVHHDPDLLRLWGQSKKISDLRFNELHKFAPQVPLLSEVIEAYGKKMHLFIELKAPFEAEAILVDHLSSLSHEQDYHIISLDDKTIGHLKKIPKKSRLLVSTYKNTKKYCQLTLEKSYGGVLGHYLFLTDHWLKQLQLAGQKTGVGFVDSKYSLYREVNRGIPWVFTNQAHALHDLLKHMSQ